MIFYYYSLFPLSLTTIVLMQVVLAAQLTCWTGQFIGHGVFEVTKPMLLLKIIVTFHEIYTVNSQCPQKRAPALFDNLTQAFVMAPFFVLFEVIILTPRDENYICICVVRFTCCTYWMFQALQMFFSYEPYPGFHARVQAKIDEEIKEWKEGKQKKNA